MTTTKAEDNLFNGKIELIIGPMFAGKSNELIRRINMNERVGKKCLSIKHITDQRYDDDKNVQIVSHDGNIKSAIACSDLNEIVKKKEELKKKFDVIAIDEGQFFPNLSSNCNELANYGFMIIISCLSGSINLSPIGDSSKIIPVADKITMLRSMCKICRKNKAPFTKEIVSGTVGSSGVKVGGDDIYLPVCRECFNK